MGGRSHYVAGLQDSGGVRTDAAAAASAADRTRRSRAATAVCDGLTVTSSLSHDEPVTEDEIRLFLGAFDSIIGQIFGSGSTE